MTAGRTATDPTGDHSAGSRRRVGGLARPLLSLLAAAVCVAAVTLLARTAVGTASGQRLDELALSGALAHEGRLAQYAELAVGTVSLPVIAVLLALSLVLVLVRGRWRLLLPLAVLVAGANLTTQVVKHFLVSREPLGLGIEITPNSFPSGHTTLAATAVIALVLASGGARAVLAPLGTAWTASAGIGTVVLGWHRPSDVLGALVLVAAWTFLVLALDGLGTRRRLARSARRTGHGRRRRGAPGADVAGPDGSTGPLLRLRTSAVDSVVALLLALAGLAGLGVGGYELVSLQLPLDLQDGAQQATAFSAMAAVIGGCTAAWMALVLLLRTPISHRTRPGERVP
ncbi:phosphatase PAP2 family protein [Brachybacterium sp. GCM10030267]|uniref:phosphatase PAP2 family protein n=1 Tax=unclassified Brachybacterium TaxID=2623841 RepID=UPI00361F2903